MFICRYICIFVENVSARFHLPFSSRTVFVRLLVSNCIIFFLTVSRLVSLLISKLKIVTLEVQKHLQCASGNRYKRIVKEAIEVKKPQNNLNTRGYSRHKLYKG